MKKGLGYNFKHENIIIDIVIKNLTHKYSNDKHA